MNVQFYHCGKVPANFSLSFFLLSHRMPQGRRKMPFSGKAKKEQLQQKRNRGHNNGTVVESQVQAPQTSEETSTNDMSESAVITKGQSDKSSQLMDVTFSSGATGRGKFDLVFQKESNVEIAQRRELARKP